MKGGNVTFQWFLSRIFWVKLRDKVIRGTLKKTSMTNDVYSTVKKHFAAVKNVIVLSGSGAQGIKKGKKLFVMFTKGQIIVKLPPARVTEIIASGEGLPHDPGTGKPMKNWVIIPAKFQESWIRYCEEAYKLL